MSFDITLRDPGGGFDVLVGDTTSTTAGVAILTAVALDATTAPERLVPGGFATATLTSLDASTLISWHELAELGLAVVHEGPAYARLNELGLMVAHDARVPTPIHRLAELGLMVVFGVDRTSRGGIQGDMIQGEMLHRQEDMQGNRLRHRRGQM